MQIKSSNGREVATAEIWVDPCLRSMAIRRAKEETKRISRNQESERQKRELLVIANVRRERIAKSQVGVRRRLIGLGTAVGIICLSFGYSIGSFSSTAVQRHVVTKEDAFLVDKASAQIAIPPLPSQQQETTPVIGSEIGLAERSLAATTATASTSSTLALQATGAAIKHTVLASVKPPSANVVVIASKQVQRVVVPFSAMTVTTKASEPSLPNNGTLPAEDPGVVLLKPRLLAPTVQQVAPAQTDSAVISQPVGSREYSVVNLIEGIVVVRQGQSVRQIKVGGKMPDGKILKSVNVDKGLFETLEN